MTAAGLALIAGGLATLISFRSFLFGGGERRARRQPVLEAPRRRPALAAEPAEVPAEVVVEVVAEVIAEPVVELAEPVPVEETAGRSRRSRRGRRRALVPASEDVGTPYVVPGPSDEDAAGDRGGLASIGLAGDDGEFDLPEAENEPIPAPLVVRGRRGRRSRSVVEPEPHFEEPAVLHLDELDGDLCAEADRVPEGPRADRYGDRVEGWVRPEYHEPAAEPRPGEYWTPIPVDLEPDPEPSAKGYGWPRPVERLPAVPDYEPATGFDMRPVQYEPTEAVPVWPMNDEGPGRVRLPRSWAVRNEKPEPLGTEKPGPAPDRRRPRPRPRPSISEIPEAPPPVDRSTMYVSRHAADPPPR
ncbi:hypothetical protein Adu01nite_08110 [Paractinoplanes durhamensis]|uniref:Uncharacterized protein n=2 Tax=Paractinoplanes durhamensis TaxID=113563 RepID=A0ABQ3YPF6_9ACTN|nr:hypothetical protein Adu01nite_08110 [Actinoplanes durhamensis]